MFIFISDRNNLQYLPKSENMSKGVNNKIKLDILLKLCNKTKNQNIIEFNTVMDIIEKISKQEKYISYTFLNKIIRDEIKNVCKK